MTETVVRNQVPTKMTKNIRISFHYLQANCMYFGKNEKKFAITINPSIYLGKYWPVFPQHLVALHVSPVLITLLKQFECSPIHCDGPEHHHEIAKEMKIMKLYIKKKEQQKES